MVAIAGLAAAAVAAGGAAYSSSRAAGAQNRATDVAQQQANIAQQLFGEATPLRQAGLANLLNFQQTGALPPGLNVGLERMMTTGREGLEGQFNAARANLLANNPMQGGQLNQALANLELTRAGQVGTLGANILGQYELPMRTNLQLQSLNTALGQGTQALQGFGSAGGLLGNLAATQMQQAGQGGQAAGSMLALALKKQGLNRQTQGLPAGYTGSVASGMPYDPDLPIQTTAQNIWPGA